MENPIVPIKSNDKAIVSISNQISLTNKLLANVERDKVFDLLIRHSQFTINILSLRYPLNKFLIDKFQGKWNWKKLSENISLDWSEDLIDTFIDLWSWEHSSDTEGLISNAYLPWSVEFIEKYKEKIDWEYFQPPIPLTEELYNRFPWDDRAISYETVSWTKEFVENLVGYFDEKGYISTIGISYTTQFISSLRHNNWNENLITRYESKWDWNVLSDNENIISDLQLFERFKDKWNWNTLSRNSKLSWSQILNYPYGEITFIEKYKDKWDWQSLSWNESLPWSEKLIDKYFDRWEWKNLSFNKALPWSESLIGKYEDKWDWSNLSRNNALPWSEEFFEKYKDKWDWSGLSDNNALPWSEGFIDVHEDKWHWKILSLNTLSAWAEGIICKYHDKLDWNRLTWNNQVWEKAFKPYIDNEMIEEIMEEIFKS